MSDHVIDPQRDNPVIARRAGNLVFLAACDSVDRRSGQTVASGTMEEQGPVCLSNLVDALVRAGLGTDDVVKLTVYLTSLENLPAFERSYREIFAHPGPALTVIGASELPCGSLVQVDAVAETPPRRGSGL